MSFEEFKTWCKEKNENKPQKKKERDFLRSSTVQFIHAMKEAKELSVKEQKSKEAEKQRLESRVLKHNLYMNDNIDHEGDCLFDSVANQLKINHSISLTKEEVRTQIVEWLRKNKDKKIVCYFHIFFIVYSLLRKKFYKSEEGDETLEFWVNLTLETGWEDYVNKMARNILISLV